MRRRTSNMRRSAAHTPTQNNPNPNRTDPEHSTLATPPWWPNTILRTEYLSTRSSQRKLVAKWYKAKESLNRDNTNNLVPSLSNVHSIFTLTKFSSCIQSHALKYPNPEESASIEAIHRKLCDDFMASQTLLLLEARKLQLSELDEQITNYSTCERNLNLEVSTKKNELMANTKSLLSMLIEDRANFTNSLEFKTAAKHQKVQLALISKPDKLEIDMVDPQTRTNELVNRIVQQKLSIFRKDMRNDFRQLLANKPVKRLVTNAKTSPPAPKNKQAVPKPKPKANRKKNVSPPLTKGPKTQTGGKGQKRVSKH